LAVRGLALNEDKTSIIHASRGFDFLGFNIRRYPNGKLLIKPSTAAIKRIRQRLREVFRAMRGATTLALIQTLNPIISGWAAYYRTAVSSAVFSALDDYVWKLALKWATRRHRNKPKRWIADRYFGRFHPHRKDRWVLGDRDSGVYLQKFSWTRIVRHQLVTGGASPDDPALADYWARRRPQAATPARRVRPLPAPTAARALPALRGLPAARRPRPHLHRGVGAVVPRHPQGDQQAQPEDRRERGARHAGQEPDSPRTHPMSTPRSSRRHRASTSASRSAAHAACLSRVRGNLHARF
jgi:Group II intron, maturase-specific domain